MSKSIYRAREVVKGVERKRGYNYRQDIVSTACTANVCCQCSHALIDVIMSIATSQGLRGGAAKNVANMSTIFIDKSHKRSRALNPKMRNVDPKCMAHVGAGGITLSPVRKSVDNFWICF